ncbi:c-type cytochrome [uncultured Tateyamaria sp.]|uniref:c-type cytochrome n=1 Tax=uncultured Tateyamaria sp. TaxID=455651 RepID=UPI002604CA40|nr:c-type cytochrome [uncultured Tateyamaria sp.]
MKQLIATFALICTAPLTALAQDISTGATLYQRHCATCHGVEADGKGPMRPALLLQPPSLLDLAARNDGTFPIIRVVSRIDGRDPLVSHGSPMPVYGWYFEGEDTAIKAETGQPILTSQPIVDLMAYLESIQE